MTISVQELDELPSSDAAALLRSCNGSARWVKAMAARRPFGTLAAALAEADDVWATLDEADWREAFAHHPRIGERRAAAPGAHGERAASWSAAEQGGADEAEAALRVRLAEMNHDYEARFGHIYIVCATGRSAEEMLGIARGRLANDPETELRVAADEQRQITRLRLAKLLADGPDVAGDSGGAS